MAAGDGFGSHHYVSLTSPAFAPGMAALGQPGGLAAGPGAWLQLHPSDSLWSCTLLAVVGQLAAVLRQCCAYRNSHL